MSVQQSKQEHRDMRAIAWNRSSTIARMAAHGVAMQHGRVGQQRNNADRYAQVERQRHRIANVLTRVQRDAVGNERADHA